jgi:hypothetical protein
MFGSPCQMQCELLPSLGVRRPLTKLTIFFLIYTYLELSYIYMYCSRSGPFDIHIDNYWSSASLGTVAVLNTDKFVV